MVGSATRLGRQLGWVGNKEDDAAANVSGPESVVGLLGVGKRQSLDRLNDRRFATGKVQEFIELAAAAPNARKEAGFVRHRAKTEGNASASQSDDGDHATFGHD